MARAQRRAELARDLQADRVRRQHVLAGSAHRFTHGEYGGNQHCAGMPMHVGLHIVEIERVAEYAVDECRLRHGAGNGAAPDGGFLARAEIAHITQGDFGNLIHRAGKRAADGVDQRIARCVEHVGGDRSGGCIDDELCQALREHGKPPCGMS
jgi:hypothetical protein